MSVKDWRRQAWGMICRFLPTDGDHFRLPPGFNDMPAGGRRGARGPRLRARNRCQRYQDLRHDRERPLLAPEEIMLTTAQFQVAITPFARSAAVLVKFFIPFLVN